jgi:predicted TIM-barrel fold metal-dependent hydrolase
VTLTRRRFVTSAVAAATKAATAAAASAVIDTHIHLYDPRRPQGVPWPPKDDALLYRPVLADEFESLVRPLGVTGAVIIEASPWLEDNQWVLDVARNHPFLVAVIGHLEPGTPEFRVHLARFVKNPLFRGIRLSGAAIRGGTSRPEFVDDLRRLADAGLMMDAIGDAAMIPALSALAGRIPALRIAIDHMPVEPPGWNATPGSRAALRDLAAHPGIYAKVSGVLRRATPAESVTADPAAYTASLDEVWRMFGESRVMYGSNWPVSDRMAAYATVLTVVRRYVESRGAAAAEQFFAANARACYRFRER